MNLINKQRLMKEKKRNCRGVAAVEFALMLSIWITLLLGVVDGSYYLLVNERVDRIAYTVTDIVTQYQKITLASLSDIMLSAGQLMEPLSFNPATLGSADANGRYPPATGYIILTSVFQDPVNGPIIKWQYTYPPAGNGVTVPVSHIGSSATDSPAVLPVGLTLNSQDNVIITEVFFTFSPLFLDEFVSRIIYRQAVYKPRLSPLITPPT
jgi:Flp pilus assembly protein TadG